MEHDISQPRSLLNLSRVKKQQRAEDSTEEEQWNDFLHSDQGKSWLASVLQREHELRGSLSACGFLCSASISSSAT